MPSFPSRCPEEGCSVSASWHLSTFYIWIATSTTPSASSTTANTALRANKHSKQHRITPAEAYSIIVTFGDSLPHRVASIRCNPKSPRNTTVLRCEGNCPRTRVIVHRFICMRQPAPFTIAGKPDQTQNPGSCIYIEALLTLALAFLAADPFPSLHRTRYLTNNILLVSFFDYEQNIRLLDNFLGYFYYFADSESSPCCGHSLV